MSASTIAAPPRMSTDEFLAWSARQPERCELDHGEVVAMAPERLAHALMKARVFNRLRDAIARAGAPCEAFPDGMAVRVDGNTVYEPDAQVRCGPPLTLDAVIVLDPMIVVEVRSPSTGSIDAGVKLAGYFRVPSLRHYLIVRTSPIMVIHHARGEADRIASAIIHDGVLKLDPPGLVVEGIFAPLDSSS